MNHKPEIWENCQTKTRRSQLWASLPVLREGASLTTASVQTGEQNYNPVIQMNMVSNLLRNFCVFIPLSFSENNIRPIWLTENWAPSVNWKPGAGAEVTTNFRMAARSEWLDHLFGLVCFFFLFLSLSTVWHIYCSWELTQFYWD